MQVIPLMIISSLTITKSIEIGNILDSFPIAGADTVSGSKIVTPAFTPSWKTPHCQ